MTLFHGKLQFLSSLPAWIISCAITNSNCLIILKVRILDSKSPCASLVKLNYISGNDMCVMKLLLLKLLTSPDNNHPRGVEKGIHRWGGGQNLDIIWLYCAWHNQHAKHAIAREVWGHASPGKSHTLRGTIFQEFKLLHKWWYHYK